MSMRQVEPEAAILAQRSKIRHPINRQGAAGDDLHATRGMGMLTGYLHHPGPGSRTTLAKHTQRCACAQ
eukprot:9641270-Prorocentrum_lima.AAC.1